jgi:hypothetical protein
MHDDEEGDFGFCVSGPLWLGVALVFSVLVWGAVALVVFLR